MSLAQLSWGQLTLVVCAIASLVGGLVGRHLRSVVSHETAGAIGDAMSTRSRPGQSRDSSAQSVRSARPLSGRLRGGREWVRPQYPLLEAGTAMVFASVTALLFRRVPVVLLIAVLWLAAGAVALSIIDARSKRLPDRIILRTAAGVVPVFFLSALAHQSWSVLGRATAGATVLFIGYLFLLLAWPGGLGFGDVKLAPLLGFVMGWFGWPSLVLGSVAPFLLAMLIALALAAAGRLHRTMTIPFGPPMLLGAFLGIALGDVLARWYLNIRGVG
ncbi:prepilin peptidase [Cellulomonas endophytica]|uniref:prepilin peptidase n=1 Tax=Cellulomonas endophytica TaxID=2494735 RepID=UPI0013E978C2|nr:A24 family peptidase [Cellulomonas endophytica]